MTANAGQQPLTDTKKALLEIRRLREELAAAKGSLRAPVAIIGVGMRFPGGVRNADQYWELLISGTDAIREIPPDRWDVDAFYNADRDRAGSMYTRHGGFIDDVDRFDPQFFGIAPREAETMDPQHRLALEVAWEALEDAGMGPGGLAGSRGGVFLGLSNSDYERLVFADPRTPDTSAATGNNSSVAAGRISYLLGLQGPAMVVDTACSSSLVALHLAVQSLRRGECDFALAGGVNLILTPEMHINFCRAQMLSEDGRCKTFDARADGYSRGEGCGFVVLRRLDDAVQRGERVLAVVRGSAVNQDGHSAGLTAPNGVAQEAVIRDAMADAGIEPAAVGYVEAHGTGTPLGDPIEARALGAVYGRGREPSRALMIGSVKTNMGHLEAAAGIAGIIKVALVLQHGDIPPLLHFTRANPEIPLPELGLHVASEALRWPENIARVAGVSSFGFSGTNAHVLLESPPPAVARHGEDPPECVLTLSARSESALLDMQRQYASFLSGTDRSFADIACTAGAGRSHFEYRLAVVASSAAEARRKLEASGAAASMEQRRGRVSPDDEAPRVVLLFSGQGAQHAGMGRELYRQHAVFRSAIDEVVRYLDDGTGGLRLLDVMFDVNGAGAHIDDTRYTQPAVFAMGYGLWKLWQSWGVVPDVVLGHSLGEYMAAHAAGLLGLEDAARLVSARAQLSATLPPGSMAAVFAGEPVVRQAIEKTGAAVDIAAINGPDNTVISGPEASVGAVTAALEETGIEWRKLKISNAFHSRQLEPILASFASSTSGLTHAPASVAFLSNLSGNFLPASRTLPADYWLDHLRNPVRFAESIDRLEPDAGTVFIEIGPHPVLLGMVERIAPQSILVPSMQRTVPEWSGLMEAVANLYVNGVDVDWAAVYRLAADAPRRTPAALPTYPFRRERYWLASTGDRGASSPEQPGLAWQDVVRAGTGASYQGPLNLRIDALPAGWDALRRVTIAAVYAAVETLGIKDRAGTMVAVGPAMRDAGILPTYDHLFRRWLTLLRSAGLARFDQDADTFAIEAAAAPADAEEALAEARRIFASELFLVDYIERCGAMLPDVVTGKTPALETLFPDGQSDTAEKLYTRFSVSRYISGIASAAVAAKVASHTRPLRILEIGAGTGGTTAAVLPALPGGRTTYCFTDISDYFLSQAANRFRDYPFVEYRLLDVGSDLAAQGYRAHEFDVVIATNVLHATPDLRKTLANVVSLLAGDGVLVLCEVTRELEWYDISTGLIEGWQSFDDDLRGDSPMLDANSWKTLLAEAGFSDVVALPGEDSPADAVGQSVILALAPAGERAAAAGSSIRTAESEPSSDVAQPAFRSRLLEVSDNERFDLLVEHVLDLVTAILRLPQRPDSRAGLFDLGLDSLMALDFRRRLAVSLDLETRLPATLIFDHPNAEAIARYLESDWLQLPGAAADPTAVAAVSGSLSDDELAALSDEEVEALLTRQLESGSGR